MQALIRQQRVDGAGCAVTFTRELRQEIEKIFVNNEKFCNMMVPVLSFGFKYGIPADAHWICAAALSGGLLMGGMGAFTAYATRVAIEEAKKQVSALEEEKKKVESTLNELEGLKADTAAYVKKLDGSLSSLAEIGRAHV